jgi:prepilin-type N-terminal cleavage/methylation domain-containing protein
MKINPKAGQKTRINNKGFTLLEILLSVGILASISVFAITSLSNQIEIRNELGIVNEQQHAIHAGMARIYEDTANAFLLSRTDKIKSGNADKVLGKKFFSKSETTYFTIQNYFSMSAGEPSSNFAQVKYFEKQDEKDPSKKQLIRAFDTNFKENIEQSSVGTPQVLISELKEFKLTFWNGLDFVPEWDSDSSENNGRLPKMVKIKLSAYIGETETKKQLKELLPGSADAEKKFIQLESIAYIDSTTGVPDVKDPKKEFSWL